MLYIISFLLKNIAQVVGIVEALAKAIAGIVSLTPTKKDDKILGMINTVFSAIKKILYDLSDKLVT